MKKEKNLPTREECIKIWDEHDVPENVRQHSFAVNKVAVFLAKKLKEKGIKIDVELVDRASLLHDLDKIPTLGKGNHGEETYRILKEKGFEDVGRIAKMHLTHNLFDKSSGWEDRIINYADKRCMDDKIVPLKDRFKYIKSKYDLSKNELYLRSEKAMFEFEKELFGMLKLDHKKLGDYVGIERK